LVLKKIGWSFADFMLGKALDLIYAEKNHFLVPTIAEETSPLNRNLMRAYPVSQMSNDEEKELSYRL
jgi:hypothetical protein